MQFLHDAGPVAIHRAKADRSGKIIGSIPETGKPNYYNPEGDSSSTDDKGLMPKMLRLHVSCLLAKKNQTLDIPYDLCEKGTLIKGLDCCSS
jgi:hypothetical protein